jgi:hypothetical protein
MRGLLFITASIFLLGASLPFVGEFLDTYYKHKFETYTVEKEFLEINSAGYLNEKASKTAGTSEKNLESGVEEHSKRITEINEKYRLLLKELEEQADQKVKSLMSRASKEYKAMKKQGEPIPYLDLYTKYSKAAKELENQVDASFEKLFVAFEKELAVNGFSPSYALGIREEYEELKEERHSELLKKVTERL